MSDTEKAPPPEIPVVDIEMWKRTIGHEIKAYVENRLEELLLISKHPDQHTTDVNYKEGSDVLGSAVLAAGVLVFLKAGAPIDVVLSRTMGICKMWRKEELEQELRERAEKRKEEEPRIIIAKS